MIQKECGHITGLLVIWRLLLLILPCPYSFSYLSRGSIICASRDIRIRVNKMSCHGIMTADLNTICIPRLVKDLDYALSYQNRITSRHTKWILTVLLHGVKEIRNWRWMIKYFSNKFRNSIRSYLHSYITSVRGCKTHDTHLSYANICGMCNDYQGVTLTERVSGSVLL
jgi:hypothetical protein